MACPLYGSPVVGALAIGAKLAGFLGALVAVPTAALIAVLADEYLVKPHAALRQHSRTAGASDR